MPKYGLFGGNQDEPMQTFEGDELEQNQGFVYVYRKGPAAGARRQVAAIKLADGQLVKELDSSAASSR
jgi:hypothetical protein